MKSLFSSFVSSSSSLFSSLIDSTIQPSPDDAPTSPKNRETIDFQPHPHSHTSLLHDGDEKEIKASLPDLFPTLSPITSPILSSTPRKEFAEHQDEAPLLFSTPNMYTILSTQDEAAATDEMMQRLQQLRHVGDSVNAVNPDHLTLQRENEELKSELVAVRLQLEESEALILELRQHKQPPPPLLPPSPFNNEGYEAYVSKKKNKKNKKNRVEVDKATTDSTLPPGCETLPLPPPPLSQPLPPPPPPPLSQPLLPTVHLFHDSNLKDITPNELAQAL